MIITLYTYLYFVVDSFPKINKGKESIIIVLYILVNGCDPGWTENPATGKN